MLGQKALSKGASRMQKLRLEKDQYFSKSHQPTKTKNFETRTNVIVTCFVISCYYRILRVSFKMTTLLPSLASCIDFATVTLRVNRDTRVVFYCLFVKPFKLNFRHCQSDTSKFKAELTNICSLQQKSKLAFILNTLSESLYISLIN